MSGVDVTTAILVERSVQAVADLASDPTHLRTWLVHLKDVTWQLVERTPAERIVVRTDDGPFPLEVTCTWEPYEDDPARTLVTLRTTGEPTGARKLLGGMIGSAIKRANAQDLIELRDLLTPR